MDIQAELSHVSQSITDGLTSVFPQNDSDFSELQDAERYSLFAGGKRIRPFLVLKTCSMFGGKEEDVLPLALALEMIHTYSLIHDDLPCMDNDTLRRGKPTCHIQFGEATALLAGDGLLTRAFETIASAKTLSSEQQITAVRILAKAAGDCGMLAGQVMDAKAEKKPPSEDLLLKIHSHKTGALIHVACMLGAIGAGISINENDPRIKALSDYSRCIGLAFQVIDDILDQIGEESTLGKPIGSDSQQGKTTFLSFMSIRDAEQYAVELTEQAVTAISAYDSDGILTALAYYLCNRKH